MAEHFDVVVLGGGPGGYAAALYGAAAGLQIGLIEERRVGGTCLHRGCIPAKELLETAAVLRTVAGAKQFGVNAGEPSLDLGTSQSRKQEVVDRLTRGLESLLKGRKVTVVPGTGSVIDASAHHVRVSDGTELQGDALILATGSEASTLPGLDFDGVRILNSDHVLELPEVPAHTVIVGAGAVGCEFASLLADLGTDVTLVEAVDRVLPGADAQISEVLTRAFTDRGIRVHTGARVNSIQGTRKLTVDFRDGDGEHSGTVDNVIVSVGRSAWTRRNRPRIVGDRTRRARPHPCRRPYACDGPRGVCRG